MERHKQPGRVRFHVRVPSRQFASVRLNRSYSPERLTVNQVSNNSNGPRAAPCKSASDERVEAPDSFSDLILMYGGLGGNERLELCSLGLQTERRTSARPLGGRGWMGEGSERE